MCTYKQVISLLEENVSYFRNYTTKARQGRLKKDINEQAINQIEICLNNQNIVPVGKQTYQQAKTSFELNLNGRQIAE